MQRLASFVGVVALVFVLGLVVGIFFPRWAGTHSDTRIAYLSRSGLHVVAGDGTGDRTGCADLVARVAPTWRPGPDRVLAFAAPTGAVYVFAVERSRSLRVRKPDPHSAPAQLKQHLFQRRDVGRRLNERSPFPCAHSSTATRLLGGLQGPNHGRLPRR